MKHPILLLMLLIGLPICGLAQSDSLQHYLIKPAVKFTFWDSTSTKTIITPPFTPYPPYPPYPPPYIPYGNVYYFGESIEYHFPECGETFHENGQLAWKIECENGKFHGSYTYWNEKGVKTSESNYINGKLEGKYYAWSNKGIKTREENYVNGQLQGKATHWNEYGHKLYEYTYAYDKLYKEKTYTKHGKIKSIEHYTYDHENERLLHGVCIYYSDNSKNSIHYNKGILHGLSTLYENGIKTIEEDYNNGKIQYQKKWNTDGKLIVHNTYNIKGQPKHQQLWNENGVLITEKFFKAGRGIGIWMNYYPPTESKTLTYYNDTLIRGLIKEEVYSKNKLVKLSKYTNNVKTDIIYFYNNGDKKSQTHTDPNYVTTFLVWDENQVKTDSLFSKNDKLIKSGFFTSNDTLYNYSATNPNSKSYIKRWAMANKDTLRVDYIKNSIDNKNQILQSNYYAKNSQGIYKRHGIWSFYTDNTISHALTYNYGNITGRAVCYDTTTAGLVTKIGFYNKGNKHGKWQIISDSIVDEFSYKSNELNGLYYQINSTKDTLVIANYQNNVLNGNYIDYYIDGTIKTKGFYKNGVKAEHWKFFNSDGIIKESGYYENDKRFGKWLEWYTNDKGKLKKRKIIIA